MANFSWILNNLRCFYESIDKLCQLLRSLAKFRLFSTRFHCRFGGNLQGSLKKCKFDEYSIFNIQYSSIFIFCFYQMCWRWKNAEILMSARCKSQKTIDLQISTNVTKCSYSRSRRLRYSQERASQSFEVILSIVFLESIVSLLKILASRTLKIPPFSEYKVNLPTPIRMNSWIPWKFMKKIPIIEPPSSATCSGRMSGASLWCHFAGCVPADTTMEAFSIY